MSAESNRVNQTDRGVLAKRLDELAEKEQAASKALRMSTKELATALRQDMSRSGITQVEMEAIIKEGRRRLGGD